MPNQHFFTLAPAMPRPPGNKFEFPIEFENLAPVELGALL
jgi:hypothetical protein